MFQFNLSCFVHFLRNSRSKVDSHSELQKGFAVFRQVPAVFSCSPFALSTKKEFILSWANCSFYFHFLFFHVRNLLPSPFMPWEKKLRLQTPLFFITIGGAYIILTFKINLAVWIICYDSSRERKDIVAIFSWTRCVSFRDETDKNQ